MTRLRDPTVRRYVFLDDFCGSGQQGTSYCRDIVTPLKTHHPNVEVSYYVLYASAGGLNVLRALRMFDEVDCVFELDETFKAFSDVSAFYRDVEPMIVRARARQVAEAYGQTLTPTMPLGYQDGQLLLGFSHNVPDNTLPVFWYNEAGGRHWFPIFPRYPKSYGWGEG